MTDTQTHQFDVDEVVGDLADHAQRIAGLEQTVSNMLGDLGANHTEEIGNAVDAAFGHLKGGGLLGFTYGPDPTDDVYWFTQYTEEKEANRRLTSECEQLHERVDTAKAMPRQIMELSRENHRLMSVIEDQNAELAELKANHFNHVTRAETLLNELRKLRNLAGDDDSDPTPAEGIERPVVTS